jgi:UDP-GlcNAc:undecaprenyl-phosphate GlcNAc-1-phosphate transferase
VLTYVAAFLLSLVFAMYWTPVIAKAALQLGIVDQPDGELKHHTRSTPYLGGLVVFISFLLTVGVLTDFEQETLGLLLSGTIVLMVGLIDDFGAMNVSQKLLGQTLAALVLVKSGVFIRLEFVPWYLAFPLTVLWILAVTNAFNIIDVLDGLAAGVAGIAALVIAVANVVAGRDSFAFLCVVLAGAALGFLRYNFHPARIYLGDAGSLFLGFMLAALSMNAGYTRVNLVAVIAPVLILGIPLFDLAFVMYVRWRKRLPVTQGSPDHFALRLRRCQLSVRETAITAYVAGAILGSAALLMSQVSTEWALLTVAGVAAIGVVSGYLLLKVEVVSRPLPAAVERKAG